MGSVIAIVLAKLMGEKKEGRCTVSNLNLTLVGCTVSVIACELHTASNYIAPRVSGFIDRKSLLRLSDLQNEACGLPPSFWTVPLPYVRDTRYSTSSIPVRWYAID